MTEEKKYPERTKVDGFTIVSAPASPTPALKMLKDALRAAAKRIFGDK